MKKLIVILVTIIILASSLGAFSASAWETPSLMLAANYDAENSTIVVQYRILDFAGTESADFRLRYNSDVVEYRDCETAEIDNVFIEVGNMIDREDTIAIQFVDLYHVKPEDCEKDGSATIVTFIFDVINDSAEKAVFIATADSCNMDPDSADVILDRATLNMSLTEGSTSAATVDGYAFDYGVSSKDNDNSAVKKIIVAAAVTGVVFVAALAAIVIKYRKN